MQWRWKIAQAAEIRWWQQYLRGKDPAAYLDWKKNYWERLLSRLAQRPAPADTVLDVGCGPAGIYLALPEQKIHAVDPLLGQYQEKLSVFRPALFPHCQFFTVPFESFKEPTCYDWVFCMNAINHVADFEGSLKKLLDYLQPDGTLVLSIDVHKYGWVKWLLRRLPTDILHPHQHSLEDYRALIGELGGDIVQEVCYKPGVIFDYYLLVVRNKKGG